MFRVILFVLAGPLLVACGDPFEKPARPDQIEKVKGVLKMYPELNSDFTAVESDGVITKGELMEIINKAKAIKGRGNK